MKANINIINAHFTERLKILLIRKSSNRVLTIFKELGYAIEL